METLNAKGGTGSTKIYYSNGDADNNGELDPPPAGTTHPPGFVDLTPTDGKDDHQWTVPKLLRPDGSDADTDPEVHLDFYPSTPADKEKLKRKFWEKWGIEKFNALVYTHDTINGPYLSVHTWNIAPGGMPYPAGPYKIPLTVTASAPGGSDKGEKITSCSTKLEHVVEGPSTHAERERKFFQECGGTPTTNPYTIHSLGHGLISKNNATAASNVLIDKDAIVCKGNISGTVKIMDKVVVKDAGITSGVVNLYGEAEVTVTGGIRTPGGSVTIRDKAVVNVGSITSFAPGVMIRDRAEVKALGIGIRNSVTIRDGAKVDIQRAGAAGVNYCGLCNSVQIYGEGTEIKGRVKMFGAAKVFGGAKIDGTAGARNWISISGSAEISGADIRVTAPVSLGYGAKQVRIEGDAKIFGGAMSGRIFIQGNAEVHEGIIAGGYGSGFSLRGFAKIFGGNISEINSIWGNVKIHGGNFSGNNNMFYGDVVIRGGTLSYVTIYGDQGAANPIEVEDGAEIRGRSGGMVVVTGKGAIARGARILCQNKTLSGDFSGTHGTCPP